MFGESGASEKNCIWSATLTQGHEKKKFLNVNVAAGQRCRGRLFNCARRSTGFHHLRAMDTGMHRTFALPLAIFDLVRTRHNAPHILEG
jgi:hypothetical protein